MPSTASKNCSILKFATKSKIASTSLSSQYKSPNSTVGSEIGAEDLEISVNKSRDGVAKLVESFTSTIEEKWAKMLSAELRADRFAKLAIKILSNIENHAIYPPLPLIFSFTKFCSPEKLKVVILGQDPYHGINQANGLAFSVQHGIRTPPSLLNIYKELSSDIEGFTVPNHGCLESWARQGVLLLNATLTVVHGQPNSHSNLGWENFTDSIIRHISEINSNLVFILWGKNAQQKRTIINRSQDHLILESFHPSPLSANRGFFGSKPFSKANMFLEEKGMVPVDWKSVCNKDS